MSTPRRSPIGLVDQLRALAEGTLPRPVALRRPDRTNRENSEPGRQAPNLTLRGCVHALAEASSSLAQTLNRWDIVASTEELLAEAERAAHGARDVLDALAALGLITAAGQDDERSQAALARVVARVQARVRATMPASTAEDVEQITGAVLTVLGYLAPHQVGDNGSPAAPSRGDQ